MNAGRAVGAAVDAAVAGLDQSWQVLAELSGRLAGCLTDEEVVRAVVSEAPLILRSDGVVVELDETGAHGRSVAVADRGAQGISVRFGADPVTVRPQRALRVALPGTPRAIGTLTVDLPGKFDRRTTEQLAQALAIVLATSLRSVRALQVERRAAEASHQRVMLDGLTSLGSRAVLFELGDQALLDARAEGRDAGLLLIDVDGFKRINDTFGHQAGDRVLAELGRRLRDGVRGHDLAVRLGGDEFVVLANRLRSPDEAELLAQRLLAKLSAPIVVDGDDLTVSASVGVAVMGSDGDTVRELLEVADRGMYAAKRRGPGQWQRSETARRELTERWSQLLDGLGRVGLDERMVLHYQPQVDASTERVVGFEAVAGWLHPELGLVDGAELASLAERSGLRAGLTQAVLARALADHRELQEVAPSARTSVTVTMRDLLDRGLVAQVSRALSEHDVPASLLTVQVDELHLASPAHVVETLAGLAALGCGLSLGGAAAASSSLEVLTRHPEIGELKLDAAGLEAMVTTPAGERMAQAMVAAAHALDVRIAAGAVDSESRVAVCRKLGFQVLQGERLRAPAPLDDLR